MIFTSQLLPAQNMYNATGVAVSFRLLLFLFFTIIYIFFINNSIILLSPSWYWFFFSNTFRRIGNRMGKIGGARMGGTTHFITIILPFSQSATLKWSSGCRCPVPTTLIHFPRKSDKRKTFAHHCSIMFSIEFSFYGFSSVLLCIYM